MDDVPPGPDGWYQVYGRRLRGCKARGLRGLVNDIQDVLPARNRMAIRGLTHEILIQR